jgi:hypothetical protein
MNNRVLLVSHLRSRGAPAQSLLIKRHLVDEGYQLHQVGRGNSGLARFLDVAMWGIPKAPSAAAVTP